MPALTGPAGPPGQVICRNDQAARLACDLMLAPGTWKVAGTAATDRVTLSRDGRVYARGRRLRFRLELVRRPRPGSSRGTLRLRGGARLVETPHQPSVSGGPLNGPTRSAVIQPP